jgi:hypothetical protein
VRIHPDSYRDPPRVQKNIGCRSFTSQPLFFVFILILFLILKLFLRSAVIFQNEKQNVNELDLHEIFKFPVLKNSVYKDNQLKIRLIAMLNDEKTELGELAFGVI